MLPGFRFLFAAILLSTSILVFGLGAAALLRATHQQYVSNPGWRNGPQEQVFAQVPEPAQPVLAVLRAEPNEPAADAPGPSLRDRVPTIALPVNEPQPEAAVTREAEAQGEVVSPRADVLPTEAPATDVLASEVPAVEPIEPEPPVTVAAAAPTDTLSAADTTAAIPDVSPINEPPPAAPEAALAASAPDAAPSKVAALAEPATSAVKDVPAKAGAQNSKAENSKAESSKAAKRKAKAKKRIRVVRRPPPQQLQQQLDPFGQPAFATTTTARTR